MRLLRGLFGALLWIVASVLGLVGVVLCVTVVLLPVGIPVLGIARRLFTSAVQFMLPRILAHPVNELTKTAKKTGRGARSATADTAGTARKRLRHAARKTEKLLA